MTYLVFDHTGDHGTVDTLDNADYGTDVEQAEMLARAAFPKADRQTLRVQADDWEPSDDQLANGPGVEGGIAYGAGCEYGRSARQRARRRHKLRLLRAGVLPMTARTATIRNLNRIRRLIGNPERRALYGELLAQAIRAARP